MFILQDNKTALCTVKPFFANGLLLHFDKFVYSSSDETILTVDAEGLITPIGLGQATVNVAGDPILGEGLLTIAGQLEIQVIAHQAMSLQLEAIEI